MVNTNDLIKTDCSHVNAKVRSTLGFKYCPDCDSYLVPSGQLVINDDEAHFTGATKLCSHCGRAFDPRESGADCKSFCCVACEHGY